MSANNSLVATYVNHRIGSSALEKLRQAGFDQNHLAIISNDSDLHDLSALDAAQYACIPRERIHDYEAELNSDRMLIVAHGSSEEIERARQIIGENHPEGWDGKVTCAVYYGCSD